MPQWTLALTWINLFKSTAVTGGSNGILADIFGVTMPAWWAEGLFPSIVVLSLHYAAFAYILIGGIFKNMDSNLEEAALILNTSKSKIFRKVTLPLLRPAILSTILLVFGSAMGSYPVPHYLKLTTLSTKYIDLKVKDNISKIYDSKILKKLLKYDEVVINGRPYKNLSYYLEYLSKEYLYNIFKNDIYSDIHGDLTIENIICNLNVIDKKEKYYIIDPNSGNINDSANLDYAKILQSIHGGYEFMMRTYDLSIEENQINFLFTKSQAYFYLYKKLNEYMNLKFKEEKIRSIYFHEIVHWLRLMPYKLKKDGKRALIFYSGLLMVLNDVIEKYGDRNENKKR